MVNKFILVAFLKLMNVLHTQRNEKNTYREAEGSQDYRRALRDLEPMNYCSL